MKTAYDYIVVGGGSAGCALANRLSANPANQVLLLEAGKMDRDILIHMPGGMLEIFARNLHQWKMPSIPQPALNNRRLDMITGKVLGGSSGINAMLHIRGTAKDYDRWAEECGCEGWAYADVLPYFRATETNKNGANEQRGGNGELHVMSREQDLPSGKLVEMFQEAAVECGIPRRDDFCDGVAEGVGWTQACIKNGKRHSAARAFIHPVKGQRPNMFVRTAEELTEPDVQIQRIPIVADRNEGGFSDEHGVTFLICLLAEKSRPGVEVVDKAALEEFIRDHVDTDFHYGGTC